MHRILAFFAVVLAAGTATAQTPAWAGPDGILGDYTVTISSSDVPAGAQVEGIVGIWAIAFHGGNHFVAHYNGQEVLQGQYQVSGDQLLFGGEGETGPYACNTPATYSWTRSGNELRFTRMGEDACSGRAIVLTTRPLTRAPAAGGAGAPPPSPSQAAPAASILGEYTATLSAADMPASVPPDMQESLVGSWRIAFHDGNHYVVHYNGEAVIEGDYRLDGNQLVWGENETGRYVCNMTATYTWSLSGNQLVLTPAGEDPCGARPLVLTAQPWLRAP